MDKKEYYQVQKEIKNIIDLAIFCCSELASEKMFSASSELTPIA